MKVIAINAAPVSSLGNYYMTTYYIAKHKLLLVLLAIMYKRAKHQLLWAFFGYNCKSQYNIAVYAMLLPAIMAGGGAGNDCLNLNFRQNFP